MAPLTLHVRGEATIPQKAELAILDVEITTQGPSRKEVSEAVAKSAKALQELLKAMSPPSTTITTTNLTPSSSSSPSSSPHPISKYTMDTFTSTSHHPRDENYRFIPDAALVHKTSVSFTIETHSFEKLGPLVSQLTSSIPCLKIHNVRWALTDATRTSFRSELRRLAAKDAVKRAEDYAAALGVERVVCVEVREEGVGSGNGYSGGGGGEGRPLKKMVYSSAMAEEDKEKSFEDVEFVPEEIEMDAAVECRFEAAGGV